MARDKKIVLTATRGVSGLSVLTGAGAPASALGRNGESYLDTSTGEFYVKDTSLSSPWELKATFEVLSGIPDFDAIDFNINSSDPAIQEGRVFWDSTNETLAFYVDGSIFRIGQDQQWHVRNNSGATITKGSVVMATGSVGASGLITIGLMDGTDRANAKYLLGVAAGDIDNNTNGKVLAFGKVSTIDTSGQGGETWSDGEVLYVSPTTAGALTNVEPTDGDINMPVAFVVTANPASGTLAVRVTPIDENSFKLFPVTETKVISSSPYNLTVENVTNYYLVNIGGDRIINLDITGLAQYDIFGLTIGAQNSIGATIRVQTVTAVGSETYWYMGEGASGIFMKLTSELIVPIAAMDGEQFANAARFADSPSNTNPFLTQTVKAAKGKWNLLYATSDSLSNLNSDGTLDVDVRFNQTAIVCDATAFTLNFTNITTTNEEDNPFELLFLFTTTKPTITWPAGNTNDPDISGSSDGSSAAVGRAGVEVQYVKSSYSDFTGYYYALINAYEV